MGADIREKARAMAREAVRNKAALKMAGGAESTSVGAHVDFWSEVENPVCPDARGECVGCRGADGHHGDRCSCHWPSDPEDDVAWKLWKDEPPPHRLAVLTRRKAEDTQKRSAA